MFRRCVARVGGVELGRGDPHGRVGGGDEDARAHRAEQRRVAPRQRRRAQAAHAARRVREHLGGLVGGLVGGWEGVVSLGERYGAGCGVVAGGGVVRKWGMAGERRSGRRGVSGDRRGRARRVVRCCLPWRARACTPRRPPHSPHGPRGESTTSPTISVPGSSMTMIRNCRQ